MTRVKTLILIVLITSIFLSSFYLKAKPTPTPNLDDDNAIDQIKVEVRGNRMFLSVFLNQPQTCEQVITTLEIKRVPIKTKTYLPICTIVEKDFIKIVFEEEVMV